MNDTIDTLQHPDSIQPFYLWHDAYPTAVVDTGTGIPHDSIFPWVGNDSLVVRPTLFAGQELVPEHSTLAARTATTAPAWVFVVVVLLCATVCIYYRSHKIKIGELLRSTVDSRTAGRMVRSQSLGKMGVLFPIALMLTAALALAVWEVAMRHTGIGGYLLLAAALAAGYFLRQGLLHLLSAVFEQQPMMNSYISTSYLHHLLLTTIAVPLLFVLVYVPGAQEATLWTVGIMTLLVFILRFSKGVQLFLTKSQSVSLFLFYYLCTIEMIPPLVLLKWFISQ